MGLSKRGGALLVKLGITRLSELVVDADKDWQEKGIHNIGAVAASMVRGDLAFSDGTGIVRHSPGPIATILMSRGEVALPMWVEGYLPVAFPLAAINITDTAARIRGILRYDVSWTCERRFRWREQGAALWTETAWANGLSFDDIFHEDLIGLTPGTVYEFQCQARHDYGTGPWSASETFETLV